MNLEGTGPVITTECRSRQLFCPYRLGRSGVVRVRRTLSPETRSTVRRQVSVFRLIMNGIVYFV